MNTIAIGTAAALGLAASLIVHLLSVAGLDVETRVPGIWLLHVGMFAVFVPMILDLRRRQRGGFLGLGDDMPKWVGMVGAILFAYVFVNFIVSMALQEAAQAVFEDGRYVLRNRGTLVREISQAEYHAHQARSMRAFSGHWLLFYFAPMAHFLLRRRAPVAN